MVSDSNSSPRLTAAEDSPGGARPRQFWGRARSAAQRYTVAGLLRGLWVRRGFTESGIVACRGGRPWPRIENKGRLTAENIGLWYGVRIEVGPSGHLSMGKGTYLNRNATVVCDERVSIGRNCAISWDVVILDTDQHERPGLGPSTAPVVIEDDVWIGCRTIVLKGVTIGRGAVVGAGSIVTRDIPAESVAVGQPARVIRSLQSADFAGGPAQYEQAPSNRSGEEQ